MGTTQSKKRRKDMQKQTRGSISYSDTMLPPRSASMDVLHPAGGAMHPSTSCPLCPHCRFTASWSSDHSLSNSLCLHHAKQEQLQLGRFLDKDGFDSCPECLQTQTTIVKPSALSSSSGTQHCRHQHYQHHHQLCEISKQDYDEIGTMSLNRKVSGRQGSSLDCNSNNNNKNGRSGVIVQSKSAEFGDFSNGCEFRSIKKHSPTKENLNPVFCNFNNRSTNSENHGMFGDVDNHRRTSETVAVERQSTSNKNCTRQMDISKVTSVSSMENSSVPAAGGNDSHKETKSNLSLLEDEEMIRSRWVRRKQMAQELRNLRMKLQHEEDARHQTNVTPSQIPSSNLKPYSFQNDEARVEDRDTVTNSFTSTTARAVSHAGNVFGSGQQTELSKFTVTTNDSKNSSTNATNPTTMDTSTTSTVTDSITSATVSPSRRSIRSKFSKLSNYRFLDNHPVMTRLQNEQNNRLELMERRMEEIRISAMQEAERRRFAEIFPAKDKDSETQKLLREARESLERMKEEKRKKALSTKDQKQQYQLQHRNQFRATSAPPRSDWARNAHDLQTHEDAGEIIPVIHVLSSSRETTPVIIRNNKDQKKATAESETNKRNSTKVFWGQGEWPDINLGKPLTWLWLPFMLFPLVLRMLLSMLFNSMATPTAPRNGNSIANTRWSHADRNRNLPRDKRKKSC